MPNIYRFNIGNDFVQKASLGIEDFMMEKEGKLRVALSGGSSPKEVYKKLAASEKIEWKNIDFYLVDERYVPADSDQSNERMVRECFSDKIALHAFNTSVAIEKALDDYGQKLHRLNRPLFDLVILGMGKDGHTASLFPHSPELEETQRLTVHSKSPKGITERLSLSFPAIMSSRKIIFLIRGAEKQETLEKLLDENTPEDEIPAKTILDHEDVDIYFDYSS